MDKHFSIQIATGPLDEDWLVAEINYDGEPLAEISERGEKVTIFPRQMNDIWQFPLEGFLEVLDLVRRRVNR